MFMLTHKHTHTHMKDSRLRSHTHTHERFSITLTLTHTHVMIYIFNTHTCKSFIHSHSLTHTRHTYTFLFILSHIYALTWHSTVAQDTQKTTEAACENTVVIWKQPGHLTSMKKLCVCVFGSRQTYKNTDHSPSDSCASHCTHTHTSPSLHTKQLNTHAHSTHTRASTHERASSAQHIY
jgi:hypothetical protein